MPRTMTLLTAAAICLAGLTGGVLADSPPGPPDSPVAKALARPIDLDFEKTSLDNVLKYIDEVCPDLRIVIDPAVSAAGIDPSTRVVDLKVRRVPLSAVLDLLLGDDLGYTLEPDYVLVTTRERALRKVLTVMYPVDDLIRRLSADPAYGTGAETDTVVASAAANAEREHTVAWKLVDVLHSLVNHWSDHRAAAWAHEGGLAPIRYAGGGLLVRQTTVGHRRVAEALATIRKAFGLAAGIQDLPIPKAVQPVAAPFEPQAVRGTRRRLDETIDLDFEKTSLHDVLRYVSAIARLNIVVDPALATAGIDPDARVVDFKCKRLPLRTVLSLVLGPDMGFAARQGYVLVATREKSYSRLALKAYPVADLAWAGAKAPSARARLRDSERMWLAQAGLVYIIQRLVNNNQADPLVAVWADEGGAAAAELLGGVLLVTQTEHGHARTLHVLNALRAVAAADPAKTAAPVPASPEHKAMEQTWRRLAQPIDVEFDQAPLTAALQSLARRRPDLNLIVDPAVAVSGIDLSTRTATLRLRQVPTASVLDLLLASHLDYQVQAGSVCVTLREKTHSNLPAVVYPVGDVIRALRESAVWRRWQDLIDAIQRCVNHYGDPGVAAWSDEGGAAGIEYFGRTLVVTQTRRGHARLAALLGTLRQALAWQQARQATALGPAQKVFPLSDPEAEAAARRLKTHAHVSLYGLTVDQAVQTLSRRQPGLNLVLDPRVWEAGIDPAVHRVTMEFQAATVEELLRQILPASMGFCPRPGYVLVTTREATWQHLPLVLYPVADLLDGELVRRGKALAEVTESEFDVVFDELAAGIRRQVNFESDHDVTTWASEGGPGTLVELGDVLLISQTPRGHARVLAYLNDLRANR